MTEQTGDDRAARLRQAIELKRGGQARRAAPIPRRATDRDARLNEMQLSLWLQHQMDPESPAYNMVNAYRPSSSLDIPRMEQALNQIVAQHRILRSTFHEHGESVHQIVHHTLSLRIAFIESSEDRLVDVATREARRPFDLTRGPMVRLMILGDQEQHRLLLLVIHHIIADERSLTYLWDALSAAYAGTLPGEPPHIQYDDYTDWLTQRPEDETRARLAWWKDRLTPPPEDLVLPFERLGHVEQYPRGRFLVQPADAQLKRTVAQLAAGMSATPFALCAFAFRLLLNRYTDGQAVAFATPASTRTRPETERMLGYFLTPVVVHAPVDETRTTEKAIRDFTRELRSCLSQVPVSLKALTDSLAGTRKPDRHPVFQVMFVYEERGPSPKLGNVSLEPVDLDLGESKFDLTLFVSETTDAVRIAVEYRSDRFAPAWMENLLGHFETLLKQLPGYLQDPLLDIPMLRPDEQERLIAGATGASLHDTDLRLLPEQIQANTERSPETPAVVCNGTSWVYAELAKAGRLIAHQLAAGGVRSGDRVGLFLDRSPWMLAGVLGCHWVGAAYVPLDPKYPPARSRYQLEDAGVAAVLTTSDLSAGLPAGPWTVVEVTRLIGEQDRGAIHPVPISGDAVAYILYTSGSTGHPKGVVVSHANLHASTAARMQFYASPPRRFLLLPSVAFDSSVAGIFWTLASTCTLFIPSEAQARDARELAALVAHEQITHLLCIPSLYAELLRVGGDRLACLEIAIVAGETCPASLVDTHFRTLPQTRLVNEYGPTEATVWASAQELREADASRVVPIGTPIPGVRIEVRDTLGRRVPAGVPGQVWICGPTVSQGYWQRKDLTDEHFQSLSEASGEMLPLGRCYGSGDRALWNLDGHLIYLGRQDEQIKLRGYRIEPGEIETTLVGLPEIHTAEVLVRPVGEGNYPDAPRGGDALVAFVEGTGQDREEAWLTTLGEHLPAHMIPSRIVILKRLPRLPNGKIDRGRLAVMQLEQVHRDGPARAVVDAREQGLIPLWEELLNRSEIGPDDNFFELGGHSLLVLQMTILIERDFGVALSAADVFKNPTITGLASCVAQKSGPGEAAYHHLFPLLSSGEGNPFVFCIPHFFSDAMTQRFRGERPVYGLRGVGLRAEGNWGRWPSMQHLGADLAQEISRRFPDRPLIIAGYSFGASMAFEVARQLAEQGTRVQRLYLIAPMPLDIYRFGPFRFQLDGLQKPVSVLSLREAWRLFLDTNHPLTRRPYQRLRNRFVNRSGYHLVRWFGRIRRRFGTPLSPRVLHADVRLERFRMHAAYQPGVVYVPTVIFNPKEPATDAAATWRPCFGGPLKVVEIPDPHLDEAAVDAAKRVMLKHFDELDSR